MNEYKNYEKQQKHLKLLAVTCQKFSKENVCPACKINVKAEVLREEDTYGKKPDSVGVRLYCRCKIHGDEPCEVQWVPPSFFIPDDPDLKSNIYWLSGIISSMQMYGWQPDIIREKAMKDRFACWYCNWIGHDFQLQESHLEGEEYNRCPECQNKVMPYPEYKQKMDEVP